jgi:hypothetical protein
MKQGKDLAKGEGVQVPLKHNRNFWHRLLTTAIGGAA